MYCTSTCIMPATEEAAGFCIFDIPTIVVILTHIVLNTISNDDRFVEHTLFTRSELQNRTLGE